MTNDIIHVVLLGNIFLVLFFNLFFFKWAIFFLAYLELIFKFDKYIFNTSHIFTVLFVADKNIIFLLKSPKLKNSLNRIILSDSELL